VVNLRHHVAGGVTGKGDAVFNVPGYEADYACVATGFIESLMRGYAACGISPNSDRGREVGEQLCVILYQVAGLTVLERMPWGFDRCISIVLRINGDCAAIARLNGV